MSKYDDAVEVEFKKNVLARAEQSGLSIDDYLDQATANEIENQRLLARALVDERYRMQEQAALHRGQAAQGASVAATTAGERQESAQAFETAVASQVGSIVNTLRAEQASRAPVRWLWPALGIGVGGVILYKIFKRRK